MRLTVPRASAPRVPFAVVPWDGNADYVCVGAGSEGNVTCNTMAWVERYGCSNASAAPWAPRGAFSATRWSDCPGGAVVELVTWTGGHSIPMQADFNATEYIAAWFLDGPGAGGGNLGSWT